MQTAMRIGRHNPTHGMGELAKRLGVGQGTIIRHKIIERLGYKCVVCGNADRRVLELNHIKGKNVHVDYTELLRIWKENDPDIEVRCANCNIIYEYERGNRHEFW